MGFPILVRWYLYIESGPWCWKWHILGYPGQYYGCWCPGSFLHYVTSMASVTRCCRARKWSGVCKTSGILSWHQGQGGVLLRAVHMNALSLIKLQGAFKVSSFSNPNDLPNVWGQLYMSLTFQCEPANDFGRIQPYRNFCKAFITCEKCGIMVVYDDIYCWCGRFQNVYPSDYRFDMNKMDTIL